MRKILTAFTCLLLAGCWQSTGSLFNDVKPAQPFHAGKVVSSNPEKPGEVSHALLASQKDGSYRLTVTDKKDAGDAVVLPTMSLPLNASERCGFSCDTFASITSAALRPIW